ncbi:hypothetical protein QPK87_04805 [Kamptonema cortianum]|nr:hypothetical protein [Geitlerinema splendidum]MDK3155896.1 hypothetical protein [Kamptonema cortianum]
MAWENDVREVRDWLQDQILVAWDDVVVTSEEPQLDLPAQSVVLKLREAKFSAENRLTDACKLIFEICAKLAMPTGSLDDDRLARASALRSVLVASPEVAGIGYGPIVAEIDFLRGVTTDEVYEMVAVFSCEIAAQR